MPENLTHEAGEAEALQLIQFESFANSLVSVAFNVFGTSSERWRRRLLARPVIAARIAVVSGMGLVSVTAVWRNPSGSIIAALDHDFFTARRADRDPADPSIFRLEYVFAVRTFEYESHYLVPMVISIACLPSMRTRPTPR